MTDETDKPETSAAAAALATRLDAIEGELRKIREEWPAILQGLATAYNAGVAQIDGYSGALQRTIERVAILENTIRGANLHGGEPSPSGDAATMN